jgi:membrane protein
MARWRRNGLVGEVLSRAREHDVLALGSELAFHYFMSLFPFFVLVATVGSLVAGLLGIQNPAARVADLGSATLPKEVAGALRPPLEELLAARYRTLLPLGLVGALVSATAATNSTVKALNRAHGVRETRAAGHRWLVALALTVAAGVLLTAAFGVVATGELLMGRLVAAVGGDPLVGWALGLGQWALTGVLLVAVATLVYWAAPNVRQPFRWATPGALLFGVGWAGATWLLRQYLTHVGEASVYGALAGVWVALVWFMVVATLLVLGGELNAVLDDRPGLSEVADRLAGDATSARKRVEEAARRHAA